MCNSTYNEEDRWNDPFQMVRRCILQVYNLDTMDGKYNYTDLCSFT